MSEQHIIPFLQDSIGRLERRVDGAVAELKQDFRDKHADNIGRFDRQDERLAVIETDQRAMGLDVKRINGSVGKHETILERHASQIRWVFSKLRTPPTTQDLALEQRKLTVKDAFQMAAIAFGLVSGTVTATYFILKDLLHWGPVP